MQEAHLQRWEMDMVSNAMTWSADTDQVFGVDPNNYFPTLSDYLGHVAAVDRERVHHFFEQVMKTGKSSTIEHRLVIGNDETRLLAVQAGLKVDETTSQILLTGTVKDLTGLRSDHRQQRDLPDGSGPDRQAGRLTRLSYNIRTPLSSIVSLLYLLDKSNLSIQQRELIEDLKTSVDDLSMVLNELLNYSLFISEELRLQEEAFDLQGLLDAVARSGQFKSEQAGFTFSLQQPDEVPAHVIGDASKLEQLLLNLLELAIIHNLGGKQIAMTAEMIRTNTLRITIDYQGVLPVLGVADRDPELESPPPYPFPQGDQSTTHLSAYIAFKLSRLLGGSLLREQSAENHCRLGLELSLQPGDPGRGESGQAPPRERINILLVEDHFLNQIATKRVLTSWSDKVQVLTADTGEEALEVFARESVDLVLMDLKLPQISGIEAARMIRQKSRVPIIALTASSSRQEEERCFTVGMNAYLHKPIRPEELYLRITQLIG